MYNVGTSIAAICIVAMKAEGRTGDIRIGYGYDIVRTDVQPQDLDKPLYVNVENRDKPLVVCICNGRYSRIDRVVDNALKSSGIHASTNGNFCPFEFASMKVE